MVESAGCPVRFPAAIAGGFQGGFQAIGSVFGHPHIHGIYIPINKTVFKFKKMKGQMPQQMLVMEA